MTELPLNFRGESDQKAVREQLARISKSGPFSQSARRKRFLDYLVTETLEGRGERLKGYTIARDVFERPETFDPLGDPLVRVEAGRLRDKLREYYEAEGQNDPVRIELPKRSYAPLIEIRQPATSVAQRDQPEATSSDQRQVEGDIASQSHSRTTAFLAASIIAAFLVLTAGFSAWRWFAPFTAPIQKASIAVLPFENRGKELQWDRLSDGITEDIVTDLSHSKDLFVIALDSTLIYKGKSANVRDVGRELGVSYVLQGSIQPIADRVRVTAQLIDARTGSYLWSNRYDRPVADLFKVQSEVTEKIAATLTGWEGALAEAELSLARRKPPNSLSAYDTYLLGMEAKHKVTKEGFDEGERLFRKALAIDPQLARAYVGLVYIYQYRIDLGLGSLADNKAKIMEAARNAVRLDPNDAETQLGLGHAFLYHGKAEQALEQYARAEALAPNNADILMIIAWYLPSLGQPERAVTLADKALQLNPNYPYWYNQGLSIVYFFGRQYEKSVKYSKLVTEPFAADYAYLAAASAMMDHAATAQAAATELARLDPNFSVERLFSDGGGFPEKTAALFVEAAGKAGITACVPADKVSSFPNLVRLRKCDEERTRQAPR